MEPRAMKAMAIVLELKAACFELLRREHKLPALLNLYSFIDICASLCRERPMNNRDTFETYLKRYSTWNWDRYTTYDLWSARSSLLHSYSPLGDHTAKANGAKPIFYFAWPETEHKLRALLQARGYKDFLVIDIAEIKHLAVDALNNFHQRIDEDQLFADTFIKNAEHLLSDAQYIMFEHELTMMKQMIDAAAGDKNA